MSIMMNRRMHQVTFAAVATAAMLIPAEAEACHETTVCVNFQVEGPDLVVGDLPDTEGDPAGDSIAYLPATNVRILLVPPPPEAPVMTLLDENGCFTFLTEWNDGHKLFVYPEAFLHSDDTDKNDPHIHITAHTTGVDLLDGILPTPSPVDLNGMEAGYTATSNIEVTSEWEVFAWAVWIARRVEDELVLGLPTERIMKVTADTTGTGHATFSSVYQDDHDLRFAIAHEVGHWFHQNWIFDYDGEGGVGGGYGFESQDPYCTWMAFATDAQHGIRSSEFERAAIAEGFAQFFAAWVFDDPGSPDAMFRWYKMPEDEDEAAHVDFIDPPNGSRVSLLGGTCDAPGDVDCPLGGTSAWVENVCDPDWAAPSFVSSEMDWMRLFWQFISDEVPDDDMEPTPTLEHIFLLHEYAWNEHENPTYADYDTVINRSVNADVYPYRNRFNDLAVVNGASKNAP
jgi:hypothetical protein